MNELKRLRADRVRALAEGTPHPVAFSYWDDPELLTVDSGSGVFEIHFNDMIDDWFGISSAMIVEALIVADGRDVLVHLNSPGGLVTEGLSIHSTFKQYGGKVTMRVEGLAASAASFVMLAADEILIEPNAMIMIHDALNVTVGPASEHRKTADLLDKVSNNIASMYAAKAGTEAGQWREAMLAETWYIGTEAVDAGLVDSVTDTDTAEEESTASARWSGVFASAPRRAAPVALVNPTVPGGHIAEVTPAPIAARTQRVATEDPQTTGRPAATAAGTPETPSTWEAFHSALKGLSA